MLDKSLILKELTTNLKKFHKYSLEELKKLQPNKLIDLYFGVKILKRGNYNL
jgi:hypothetical protein